MAESFSQLFGQIVNQYGPSVCDTPALLNSLLADYSNGEHRKGRRLLVWILETGCVNTLTPEQDYETWRKECAATLNSEYYIDSNKAMSMLGIIFNVLLREIYLQNRAEYLCQSNEYDKADHVYSEILNYNPSSDVALLGKGNIAVKKQNHDDVIKYFKKLSKIDPLKKSIVSKDLGIAYFNKGNRAKDEQKYQEAIDYFTKAMFYDAESKEKVEPALAEVYYLQADSEFDAKNYTAVISSVLEAVQYLHNDKTPLDSLLNKASINDLFDFYNAVINYSPLQAFQREYLYSSLFEVFLSKGNTALENQNWNQSIRCYETIIELDPSYSNIANPILFSAYTQKGDDFELNKKYDLAVECYKNALHIKNDSVLLDKLEKMFIREESAEKTRHLRELSRIQKLIDGASCFNDIMQNRQMNYFYNTTKWLVAREDTGFLHDEAQFKSLLSYGYAQDMQQHFIQTIKNVITNGLFDKALRGEFTSDKQNNDIIVILAYILVKLKKRRNSKLSHLFGDNPYKAQIFEEKARHNAAIEKIRNLYEIL